MKMKKLITLGLIAPMFAITVSCNRGPVKISFDEAFNFAVKNYDMYHHLGYTPTYIIKVNDMSIRDTKGYKQVVKQDLRTYELTYDVDTSIKNMATTIDTDEIGTAHLNSVAIRKLASYLSVANILFGYFESYFTLEDNKYLGFYIGSNELHQVLNLVGGALSLLTTGIIESLDLDIFQLLTSDYATIALSASCNNLGLLDRGHFLLEIENLSAVIGDDMARQIEIDLPFEVLTSKLLRLDFDLIVDYSGK